MSKQYGKVFEENLIWVFKNTYKNNVEVCVGTEDDKFKGTDLKVLGLRVDVTSDFDHKDHTTKLGSFQISKAFEVHYGIRFGNAVEAFEEPVLVIGMNDPISLIREYEDEILMAIKSHMEEIYEFAADAYFEEIDRIEAMA